MKQDGNDEKKAEVSSKTSQEKIGRDAINKTTTTQDKYETNIYNPIIISSQDTDALQSIVEIISSQQPNLRVVVENDSKLKEQKEDWEKSDGVFSLIDDLSATFDLVESLTFSERRRRLTKQLDPILELLNEADQSHLINAIEIVSREDEIDDTTNEDFVCEFQEELGVRRAIFSRSNPRLASRFKKIYNLLRCGDIQANLLGALNKIRDDISDSAMIQAKFIGSWNKILEYHPNKVFCTSDIELGMAYALHQVSERIKARKKKVYLYSRGTRINKAAEEIVKSVEEEFPGIDVQKDRYSIAKLTAKRFTFVSE